MAWRSKVSEIFDPMLEMVQEELRDELSVFLGTTGIVPVAGEAGSPSLLGEEERISPLPTTSQPGEARDPAEGVPSAAPGIDASGRLTVKSAEGENLKRAAEGEASSPPEQGGGKTVSKKRVKRTVSKANVKEHKMDRVSFAQFLADSAGALSLRGQRRAIRPVEDAGTSAGDRIKEVGSLDVPQAPGSLIAQIDSTFALDAIQTQDSQRQEPAGEVISIDDSEEHQETEVDAFVDSMLASGGPDQEVTHMEGKRAEDSGPVTEGAADVPGDFVGHGGAAMDEGSILAPPIDLSETEGVQGIPVVQGVAAGATGAESLQGRQEQAEVTLVGDHVAGQTGLVLHATGAEGPGPSAAPAEELRQPGEQVVSATGRSSDAGTLPFSDDQIKLLKELVGHVLKEQLTGSWALPVFRTKLNKAINDHDLSERRQENLMMRNEDMASTLKEVKEACTDFDERLYDIDVLLPAVRAHGVEHVNMRKTVNECKEDVGKNTRLINEAHDDVSKALAESEFVKSENFRMGTEMATFKKDQALETRGLAARLENLEHCRREERLTTHAGADTSIEANRLRMEGIQFFALAQASRGLFPRELLRDESIMRMIPDRDGLILAIERGERERRTQDILRGQHDHRQHYRDSPPRRYPQDRREGPSGGQR